MWTMDDIVSVLHSYAFDSRAFNGEQRALKQVIKPTIGRSFMFAFVLSLGADLQFPQA